MSAATKHKIYFHLQVAAHQIKKKADEELGKAARLTTAQSAILTIVASEGPVSQGVVAGKLRQNDSAMTAMVARLLKLGFITRERSKEDGRISLLTLTEEGKEARACGRKAFNRINGTLDNMISDEEMAVFAKVLDKISSAF